MLGSGDGATAQARHRPHLDGDPAAALYQTPPPPVTVKPLNGDISYVQLPGFFPGAADQVLGDISNLAETAKLCGLILDLRGNGGGTVADPASPASKPAW